MEKKYPIGGYAPGSYQCRCSTCGNGFDGDKRAVQCEPCAVADKEKFEAMSPTEQEELMKRNVSAAKEMFSNWRTLTPEQIEERKEAIEWYRNPAAPLNPDLEEQANAIYQKYCTDKGLAYHLINAANFCLGYMAAKGITGKSAVWVKASERAPFNGNLYYLKFNTANTKFKTVGYYSAGKWYRQDHSLLDWAPNLEWLDESTEQALESSEELWGRVINKPK